MIRPVARVFVAALLLPLVAGCGSHTNLPQAQSGDAQATSVQMVTDIPIPPSASMDNDHSLILSDRDHWTGRVVMRFSQQTTELVAFYQAQMPAFGWEPVMSVTSETSVLSYVRGDRAATVQIEKSMLGLNTMVSVTVAPRQSGASAPPAAYSDTSSRQPVRSEPLAAPSRR